MEHTFHAIVSTGSLTPARKYSVGSMIPREQVPWLMHLVRSGRNSNTDQKLSLAILHM